MPKNRKLNILEEYPEYNLIYQNLLKEAKNLEQQRTILARK